MARRLRWRAPALAICTLASPVGAQSAAGAFGSCLSEVRASRASRSITPTTWALLEGLKPDPRVQGELNAQPEFRLPVWDYVAVMVDQERIDDGLARLTQHRAILAAIALRYGVEPELLLAIWGIESDYGRNRGGYSVLRSLATLSCTGRRQTYFRRELRAALRVIQREHFDTAAFVGSWAGAFGQTQFMPGTFEWLAVDFDGDGKKDVIGSIPDALASAANYLRNARWGSGAPWGFEVRLPTRDGRPYDLRGEGRRVRRSLASWAARGLTRADGSPVVRGVSGSTLAGLFAPAGASGPAFLVFDNYSAVYRYNASEHYTLSVLHLSDRLRGGAPFVTPWPTDDLGLSRAERRELQELLTRRGHEVGTPRGVLTPATREAVKAEQRRVGHEPTGRPGQKLLQILRSESLTQRLQAREQSPRDNSALGTEGRSEFLRRPWP